MKEFVEMGGRKAFLFCLVSLFSFFYGKERINMIVVGNNMQIELASKCIDGNIGVIITLKNASDDIVYIPFGYMKLIDRGCSVGNWLILGNKDRKPFSHKTIFKKIVVNDQTPLESCLCLSPNETYSFECNDLQSCFSIPPSEAKIYAFYEGPLGKSNMLEILR